MCFSQEQEIKSPNIYGYSVKFHAIIRLSFIKIVLKALIFKAILDLEALRNGNSRKESNKERSRKGVSSLYSEVL